MGNGLDQDRARIYDKGAQYAYSNYWRRQVEGEISSTGDCRVQ